MKRFLVLIGPRRSPRLWLEVFSADSHTAWNQHVCLAQECERVEVLPL